MFVNEPKLYKRLISENFLRLPGNLRNYFWNGKYEELYKKWNNILYSSVAIDVRPIKHIYDDQKYIPIRDIVPPFENVWFELGEHKASLMNPYGQDSQTGILCKISKVDSLYESLDRILETPDACDKKTYSILQYNFKNKHLWSMKLRESRDGKVRDKNWSGFVYEAYYFSCLKNDKPYPSQNGIIFIADMDGNLIPKDSYSFGSLLGFNEENLEKHFQIKTDDTMRLTIRHEENLHLLLILIRIFAFLNIKNIKLEGRNFNDKFNRHMKRKAQRTIDYSYKILTVVKPGVTRESKNNKKDEAEEKRPLHLVRGHIRRYVKKGLFGKYFGNFYIPSHTRGEIEFGISAKDYKLK